MRGHLDARVQAATYICSQRPAHTSSDLDFHILFVWKISLALRIADNFVSVSAVSDALILCTVDLIHALANALHIAGKTNDSSIHQIKCAINRGVATEQTLAHPLIHGTVDVVRLARVSSKRNAGRQIFRPNSKIMPRDLRIVRMLRLVTFCDFENMFHY